jgi:hypothetical protein
MVGDARALVAAGLSVIPVATYNASKDVEKRPALKAWLPYQQRRPTDDELRRWFDVVDGEQRPLDCSEPVAGVGLVTGALSGVLTIDFDLAERYGQWRAIVDALLPDAMSHCVVVRTPRPGVHVHVRCLAPPKNEKLAMRPQPSVNGAKPKLKATIETRGEGGYVLTPHCLPCAHPSGHAYAYDTDERTLLDLPALPPIDPDDLATMLEAARQLDETPADMEPRQRPVGCLPPAAGAPAAVAAARAELEACGLGLGVSSRWEVLPGADYDFKTKSEDLLALLERHGAAEALRRGDVIHVRRPGKDHGSSATIGYVRSQSGAPCLRVFSTSWHPFECRSYTPFGVYALLEHGGDFRAACAALAEQGYGQHREQPGEKVRASLRSALALAQEEAETAARRADAEPSDANRDAEAQARSRVKDILDHIDRCDRDDAATRKRQAKQAKQAKKEAEEQDVAGMAAAAQDAGTDDGRADVVDLIRQTLGIPIAGIVQQRPEDARYFLLLEDGRRIPVGSVEAMQDQKLFERVIMEHFRLRLPPRITGKARWQAFSSMLLSIVVLEEAEVDGMVLGEELLREYLSTHVPVAKEREESWHSAVEAKMPVKDGDWLCITAAHLGNYRIARGERSMDERETCALLDRLGFKRKTLNFEKPGKRSTRSYYVRESTE